MTEYIHQRDWTKKSTQFRVTISQTGPRGGKRPPLIDAWVWADSYDEAHGIVERRLLKRCTHVVTA